MNTKLRQQLLQINQEFYERAAPSFAQTREKPWVGMEQACDWLIANGYVTPTTVFIDLACGSGRWLNLLQKKNKQFSAYFGIDHSVALLKIAADNAQTQQLSKVNRLPELDPILLQQDLISQPDLPLHLLKTAPDAQMIATAFGFLHHLPGKGERSTWLRQVINQLPPKSLFIFTCWQFEHEGKIARQHLSPSWPISPALLESGDFFLPWQDKPIWRYCHSFANEEIAELIENSQVKLLHRWQADGKSGQMNAYVALQT